VFYGNIGSVDRLDFTVVVPAVNETSRIAAMCQSVDRSVVLSSDFVTATPEPERATPRLRRPLRATWSWTCAGTVRD
jgi:adenylate cyclase